MEHENNKTRFLSMSIASFFGIGFFPFFPGTLASAVTLAIAFCVTRYAGPIPLIWQMGVFILLLSAGLLTAADLKKHRQISDPSWFVMDEVAGMWMALIALPKDNLIILIAVFIVFRACDILKPWIIRKVDNMEHASAIMLDDLLAAVPAWLTGFILWKVL